MRSLGAQVATTEATLLVMVLLVYPVFILLVSLRMVLYTFLYSRLTSMDANLVWLKHRVEQYPPSKTDTCGAVDDFGELAKLGHGFTSVVPLESLILGMALCLGQCI